MKGFKEDGRLLQGVGERKKPNENKGKEYVGKGNAPSFSHPSEVLDEYQKNFGDSWRSVQADGTQPWPYLIEALQRFQDPAEADKLMRIQRELDETKIILHKTIDSVLARGEKLDSLVEKSSDLSAASQLAFPPSLPDTHVRTCSTSRRKRPISVVPYCELQRRAANEQWRSLLRRPS
ncbi:hypothetical protein TIFTF001_033136 [Ficus carica]|uniref:V-SNARE coiled-coil homology domain-containing protein n=1 Tax=Ficus carica TaxID=3494 RepID=A0AA88DZW7_FICCA|nr:hypothetical protein TIFTF001_033136 [Ficus carica]